MELDDPAAEARTDPRASVEAYEEGGSVVLHDAENPLGWLQSTRAYSVEETR